MPLGAIAAAGILLLVNIKGKLQPLEGNLIQQIKRFDPLGNLLFVGAVLSLLLALHWAGEDFAYSNARIIVLFVLFGVFLLAFVSLQIWQNDQNVSSKIKTILILLTLTSYSSGSNYQAAVSRLRSYFCFLRWWHHISYDISLGPLVPSR